MPAPNSRPPDRADGLDRPRRWAAGIAAVLFMAWLFFPLAYARFRGAAGPAAWAGREAANRPERRGRPLADYLRDFSVYYEKSSPVRRLFLPGVFAFKVFGLGASSVSSVVVGRGGWLFLGEETESVDELRYFLGTHLLREDDLARWLRVLGERRRWLEARGIAYWVIVAPNKSTVYPEYLPAVYPRGRRTRLDQLLEALDRQAPGFPLIDLRPVLRAGKKERQVYFARDTHWNDFGRDLAYREIVRRLAGRFPALRAIPEVDFVIQPGPARPLDLEELLLLPWKPREPYSVLLPRKRLPSRVLGRRSDADRPAAVFVSRAPGAVSRALLIHDSFGATLRPLLSVHFKRSRWILDRGHGFPAAWIEKNRPRLVIDEIVERYLEEEPWSNPPGLEEAAGKAH